MKKLKIYYSQLMLLAVIIAISFEAAWAQVPLRDVNVSNVPPVKMAGGQHNPFEKPSGLTLPSFGWTKEEWIGNDKPFLILRTQIDREVKAHRDQMENLKALVNRYRIKAGKQPLDSQAQFAWAYSAYQSNANGLRIHSGWGVPRELSLALAQARSPKSYQYDRLRFLIAGWWQTMPELIALSQRLLRRNPQDYEAKFYAVKVLSAGSEAQVRSAVRLAEGMIKERPRKRSSHAALAEARWGLFIKTQTEQDGRAAITTGRNYLSLLPKDSPSRAESESIIRSIQKKLAS